MEAEFGINTATRLERGGILTENPFSEVVGVLRGQLEIAPGIFGFSPVVLTNDRSKMPIAVARGTVGFAQVVLAMEPTESAKTKHKHRPQDAISVAVFQGVGGEDMLVIVEADGMSTVATNIHPVSEVFAHHLVANPAPFTNFQEANSWLDGLPAVPGNSANPLFDTPTGASTLKAATIWQMKGGYRVCLAQVGNRTGATVGPTVAITPDGRVQRYPLSRDTMVYYGKTHGTPDVQTIDLPRGSLFALGSDGNHGDGLIAKIRGVDYEFVDLVLRYKRRSDGLNQFAQDMRQAAKDNPDDQTLAMVWLP